MDFRLKCECLYKDLRGKPGPCPRCGGALRKHYQTYLVATRKGQRLAASFMIEGDFGWFCAACPTVVVNVREVNEMLGHSRRDWDVGCEFALLGLVDFDAVPEERRHLTLGPDNSIPLVRFGSGARRKRGRRRWG